MYHKSYHSKFNIGDDQKMNREQTVCFTEHRKVRVNDQWRERLKKNILELIERGYKYFMTGGARGFDIEASEMILELQKLYPYINLILVLPFVNQYTREKSWTIQEIERYHALEQQAQKVIYLQERYSAGCYYRRNRYMVDSSALCICYQYKRNSGTAYTIQYAVEKGLEVVNICNRETVRR